MTWVVEYLEEAQNDIKKLDGSIRARVIKGIKKVATNPLPQSQGGYGKPLGNQSGVDLTGLMKIKFLDIGIRVVYKVVEEKGAMKIIIVSSRADNQVYKESMTRRKKHNI